MRGSKISQNGSITVLFLMFIFILTGSISYSIYIGQEVKEKIALENASDIAAFDMASHMSQGFNMIAANNLAIGASLHVAAAVPVLSAYLSVLKVATAGPEDILDELGSEVKLTKGAIQGFAWDPLKPISKYLMHVASGLTSYNDFLLRHWFKVTQVRSMESARLNKIGAVSIPFQYSNPGLPGLGSVDGVMKVSAKNTVCQSIKASENVAHRDNPAIWLAGPLETFPGLDRGVSTEVLDAIKVLSSSVDDLMDTKFGVVDCGWGLKSTVFQMLHGLVDSAGPTAAVIGASRGLTRFTSIVDGLIGDLDEPIKEKNLLGMVTGIIETGCYLAWKGFGNAMMSFVESFSNAPAASKAFFEYDYIDRARKEPSTVVCKDVDGRVHTGHFPKIFSAGGRVVRSCVPIASIDPRCAYRGLIKTAYDKYSVKMCPDMKDRFEDFHRHCESYDQLKNTKNYVAQHGINIVDTANQSEAFAKANRRAADKIGFLIIDDLQSFQRSTHLINVLIDPRETTEDVDISECPDGSTRSVEDHEGQSHIFCDEVPLTAFINVKKIVGDARNKKRDFNIASGGVSSAEEKVESRWLRSGWAISSSQSRFDTDIKRSRSHRNWLMWPAWYPSLRALSAEESMESTRLLFRKPSQKNLSIFSQLLAW